MSVFKRLFGNSKKENPKEEVIASPTVAIPTVDDPVQLSASSRAFDNMLSDYMANTKPSAQKLRVILENSAGLKKQELLRSSLLPLFLKSVATQFSQHLFGKDQLSGRAEIIVNILSPETSDPNQPFNSDLFQRLQLLVVNEETATALNDGHLR